MGPPAAAWRTAGIGNAVDSLLPSAGSGLPTPRTTTGGSNTETVRLLPTPRASDTGTAGRRGSEGFRPPMSQVISEQVEPLELEEEKRRPSTGENMPQRSNDGKASSADPLQFLLWEDETVPES